VYRGGGWDNYPASVRAANRHWFTPGIRHHFLGFRLLRTGP
jgi:formylglycine-generating enzyme required for sulfatase activity